MNLTKILKEVEFRSGEILNLKSPRQISILSEVLSAYGYGAVKNELIRNLLEGPNDGDNARDSKEVEKEKDGKDGYTSIGGAYYVKNADAEKRTGLEGGFQAKTDDAQRYFKDKASGKYKKTDNEPDNDPGTSKKDIEKSKEGGGEPEEDQADVDAEEQRKQQQALYGDKETQDRYKDEVEAGKEKEGNKVSTDSAESLRTLSKLTKNKVFGEENSPEAIVKNNMLKYGYTTFEEKTGSKPAPGGAGSAFNEIVSEEGIHILNVNPHLSEEQLAEIMYQNFGDSNLANEQKITLGVKIPDNLEKARETARGPKPPYTFTSPQFPEQLNQAQLEINKYSKCIIAARSSRTKYDRTKSRIHSLQQNGKLGSKTKLHTYYGSSISLDEQSKIVASSNNIYLPDGTKISKRDAITFIELGGGGAHPSDTATFASDENDNLMVQFHSDKTTTDDIQDNSTISYEAVNYKKTVERSTLSTEEKDGANKIISDINNEINKIEDSYINQSTPIANNLSKLPFNKQLDIIKNDKGTLQKNIQVALTGSTGKLAGKELSLKYQKFNKSGKRYQEMTLGEKYTLVRDFVAAGYGKGADVKVTNKLALQYQAENKEVIGLNVKKLISEQREQVVRLQRERVEQLNQFHVTIGNMSIPLGVSAEADEAIRGFHFSLMDFPPRDYVEGDINSIAGKAMDINMGGTLVDGNKLRKCLGVESTEEFKQRFALSKNDDLTYASAKKEIVTGKNVFSYYVDKNGNKKEIGKKTYRSKTGATGKTSNTMQYSKEIQNCFKNS